MRKESISITIKRYCKICGEQIGPSGFFRGYLPVHSDCENMTRRKGYDASGHTYFCTCCGMPMEPRRSQTRFKFVCRDCHKALYGTGEKPDKAPGRPGRVKREKVPHAIEKGTYRDFGPVARRGDRVSGETDYAYKSPSFVKVAIDDRKTGVYFKMVESTAEDKCIHCALYDLEAACRGYDCTGHYLKREKSPTASRSIDAPLVKREKSPTASRSIDAPLDI